jgi:hypothetical protein
MNHGKYVFSKKPTSLGSQWNQPPHQLQPLSGLNTKGSLASSFVNKLDQSKMENFASL